MLARHALLLTTPSISLRLPRLCRHYPPKSFPVISFADHHPLNPMESYLFKNHGGQGAPSLSPLPTRRPSRDEKPVTATPLDSALTNSDARNSFRMLSYENSRVSLALSSLFSLFAPRVFHNSFAIKRFRTLSKNSRVTPIPLPHCPPIPLSSQQIFEVAQLFPQQIQLPCQALNFRLGAPVHGVVQFTSHAILHVLPVLAHHDDRRLNGREQRQNEIQQDKWIGIPGRPAHAYVDRRIDAAQDEKTNNKGPRPAEQHHGVRDAFGQRRFCFDHF